MDISPGGGGAAAGGFGGGIETEPEYEYEYDWQGEPLSPSVPHQQLDSLLEPLSKPMAIDSQALEAAKLVASKQQRNRVQFVDPLATVSPEFEEKLQQSECAWI